ncbi:peptidylprolyl isomerase [Desulfoferrobacter suflitae]|uniref:peptidylprolyl isomerase n=1 Tax=Desulfoferrobacter suflitae TaxID=2865782 RepID=UPI002869D463|nr:peptidylprolyl isomerase [Desulfoferrobacter suflitae]
MKPTTENPMAVIETSEGAIKVELWADKAPITVKNFISYAEEGYYKGTVFHRVIDGFMIQGGGLDANLKPKATRSPIKNEAAAELKNERGTIAMARTNVVDSATSQFFINVADNDFLDHQDKTPKGYGYAVFGKVVEGMDVVDRIEKVETKSMGPHQDVPVKSVVIKDIRLVSE